MSSSIFSGFSVDSDLSGSSNPFFFCSIDTFCSVCCSLLFSTSVANMRFFYEKKSLFVALCYFQLQ